MHYWADLQSVQGLRCYGNITRTRNISEYVLVLAICLVIIIIIIIIRPHIAVRRCGLLLQTE